MAKLFKLHLAVNTIRDLTVKPKNKLAQLIQFLIKEGLPIPLFADWKLFTVLFYVNYFPQ